MSSRVFVRNIFLFGMIITLFGLIPLLVTNPVTAADEAEYAFPEEFMFRLSTFRVEQADTKLSVNSNRGVGIGTTISFADDLGGDETTTVPRLDAYYRFTPHHRIEFSNYRINRDGRRVITLDIDVEDETYEIGESIVSEINYDILRFGYAYSFYHSEQVELSFSAGLNIVSYEFDIANSDGSTSSEADVTAPLPMFGLQVGYAIDPNWSIHYLSETFFIEIEDTLEGALLSYELNVQYRFWDHFIVGGGIARFSTNLEASDDDWRGRISDSHRGILFFLSYYL